MVPHRSCFIPLRLGRGEKTPANALRRRDNLGDADAHTKRPDRTPHDILNEFDFQLHQYYPLLVTIEPPLLLPGATPPPSHDPRTRQLARWIGYWQVRRWSDPQGSDRDPQLQLWHRDSGTSLLTPSRAAGGYELYTRAQGSFRARELEEVSTWLLNHVPNAPRLDLPRLQRAIASLGGITRRGALLH